MPSNPDPRERKPPSRWMRLLVVLVIAASVVLGAMLILIAATFGSRSAFGGRCPAEQPPPIDDDTFGLAAMGAFLIAAVPTFLSRPSWRRLGLAIGVGLSSALVVGLLVRSIAYG